MRGRSRPRRGPSHSKEQRLYHEEHENTKNTKKTTFYRRDRKARRENTCDRPAKRASLTKTADATQTKCTPAFALRRPFSSARRLALPAIGRTLGLFRVLRVFFRVLRGLSSCLCGLCSLQLNVGTNAG